MRAEGQFHKAVACHFAIYPRLQGQRVMTVQIVDLRLLLHFEDVSLRHLGLLVVAVTWGGFLKNISVGIPTYASMKTSF